MIEYLVTLYRHQPPLIEATPPSVPPKNIDIALQQGDTAVSFIHTLEGETPAEFKIQCWGDYGICKPAMTYEDTGNGILNIPDSMLLSPGAIRWTVTVDGDVLPYIIRVPIQPMILASYI